MDMNGDIMQREGMQSTYGAFSSTGDVSAIVAGAHSMAQPLVATQPLMPGLFAFPSLTPGSSMQPHSMSYMLPTSSQLLSDCTSSTLAGGLSAVTNSLQSAVTPVVQPGTTGMTRPPATVPGTLLQPSSTAYTHSNRVSDIIAVFTSLHCWF